jgi:cyclopropane-fatty-acyl-phospholipid synthase
MSVISEAVLPQRNAPALTLSIWGDALEANRDKAIEIKSEVVDDRYMRYLRGCRDMFANEYCDVNLVTYLKAAA